MGSVTFKVEPGPQRQWHVTNGQNRRMNEAATSVGKVPRRAPASRYLLLSNTKRDSASFRSPTVRVWTNVGRPAGTGMVGTKMLRMSCGRQLKSANSQS